MSTEEKNPLLARIEKLEQQNRRLKHGALLSLVAIASIALAGALMAQTQHPKTTRPKTPATPAAPATPVVPDKIEAQSFVLKDSAGRARADLAMGGTGPTFRLLNQSGTALVTIGLSDGTPSGPMLLLSDPDHHASLVMSVQQGAGSQLSLTGDQNAMVHMGVTKDGTTVELFDQDGASASLGSNVKVSRSGKPQQTSAAAISLFNKDRKVLWSAP